MNAPVVKNTDWDIAPNQEDDIEQSCESPDEETVKLYALNLCFLTHRGDLIYSLLFQLICVFLTHIDCCLLG